MTGAKKKVKQGSRNPAGRPKDTDKHTAILDAAENHFLHHGFKVTSMDAISKTADVSKLTIYSHFSDKDSLFKAVIKRKCEQYTMTQDFSLLKDVPVKEALEKIGSNFSNLIMSEEAICMHRIVESEAVRHPKIAELFYEAGPTPVKKAISNLFAAWQEQKKVNIPDIEIAVEHFCCLMKGEAHMKMLLNLQKKPSPSKIKYHIDSVVALFMARYAL